MAAFAINATPETLPETLAGARLSRPALVRRLRLIRQSRSRRVAPKAG